MVEEHINGVTVYRGTGGAYDIRKAYRSNKPLMESIKNKYLEIRNYSIIKELSRVNVMFAPDVVHINCIAGMSMSAVLYFRLKRVPIVYTLRDGFIPMVYKEKISMRGCRYSSIGFYFELLLGLRLLQECKVQRVYRE